MTPSGSRSRKGSQSYVSDSTFHSSEESQDSQGVSDIFNEALNSEVSVKPKKPKIVTFAQFQNVVAHIKKAYNNCSTAEAITGLSGVLQFFN